MPTNGNDVIRGPHNGKPILAQGGDDIIYWGPGDGSTTLYGGSAGEHYNTDVYVAGNPGGDRLYITGSQGASIRFTTTENGTATVGNKVLKFEDIERVHGSAGNDTIIGSAAKMAPAAGGTPQHGLSIYGGAGHDSIVGSNFADVIDGGSGNDTIYSGSGDDFVQSSIGNDLIYGGAGNENIRWGLGNNVAPGNDTIYGGEGSEGIGDLINIWVMDENWKVGGRGVRVVFDSAESGFAYSTMGGVNNNLRFYQFENSWTHQGNDNVTGANATIGSNGQGIRMNTRWGNDQLIGSTGNDTLEGGTGRDTINGGKGNDLISANTEWYNRQTHGDGDVDTLIFRAGDGHDTVLGFDVGVDRLHLGGRSYTAVENDHGTLLRFAGGDDILLSNVFDFI